MSKTWLGLIIGNSRSHWGLFTDNTLIYAWDSSHISVDAVQELATSGKLEKLFSGGEFFSDVPISLPRHFEQIAIASVVPRQTEIWQNYTNVQIITLQDVPLKGMYPTLGIDRALGLYGAGNNFGFPILVIDAGTALTFTGANQKQEFAGGAILPGLSLQLTTLANRTGQLPNVELPQQLPQRLAMNTPGAIQSGVIYSLLAGIRDFVETWWWDFPDGKVIMTGGDSKIIHAYWRSHYPHIRDRITVERHLILWGMRELIIING
ncbi:pantothenate kinase [Calothrix sp. UHCC 0171]|uniref:pantothenate kinase n=1 Tax=Calothrix sp. UHCC 0171 TaxID=3110245 RepID=UPI002B1FEA31|nr:pantothenate kinase [Calothrix sp. UHCC 0171]MEA5569654.1 pantothenate kinase [Calothrix sp. UHCC 0171]